VIIIALLPLALRGALPATGHGGAAAEELFVSYVLYARCSHVTKLSIGLISQKRRYHSAKSVDI
jgi:hypothetical protein